MNWSQIVHWAGGHAGVVSIAGVLTLFLSAYTAHALTKSRERLKRIRDYESMSRESMQDRCIGLLDVAEEIRAWVPIHRKKLARLALKDDKTEATALLCPKSQRLIWSTVPVNAGFVSLHRPAV